MYLFCLDHAIYIGQRMKVFLKEQGWHLPQFFTLKGVIRKLSFLPTPQMLACKVIYVEG